MNREAILAYVRERYDILTDYPWARTPNYAILRQKHNRKWFGAVIDVTQDKLGLDGDQVIDVLNLKCDPLLVGSLREQAGVFPAYHMNKEHGITILLDGTLSGDQIRELIDLSYQLTA